MKFTRHWIRTAILNRLKAERKYLKGLRLGALANTFNSFVKGLAFSAAGVSLLSLPAQATEITPHGTHTKVSQNGNTYTITTDQIKGINAFNAFQKFTLDSNYIANLQFPTNTSNLLNFVYDKINIQGTVNAIKNNKIGGNLYFLSSQGLILGKGGVINAGAFFAMTPNKDFMNKFKISSGLNTDLSTEIGWITDKKFVNRDGVTYKKGIIMAPDGQITIEGSINTLNGIGIYSGGQLYDESSKQYKGAISIGSQASLNSLSDFSNVVNLNGIEAPDSLELKSDEGNIELVSIGDNSHATNWMLTYIAGFADSQALFTKEQRKNAVGKAEVNIAKGAKVNSRKDLNVEAITTNGQLATTYTESRSHSYNAASSFAELHSDVKIGGELIAGGNINIKAISDSNFVTGSFNIFNIGMTLLGATTPFNFAAYPVMTDIYSNVDIAKGSKITAGNKINVKADTYSVVNAGVSTSSISTKAALHSAGNYIPSIATIYVDNNTGATVNVAGELVSKGTSESNSAISVNAVSENRISASATAANKNNNNPALALAIGKGKNDALINVNPGGSFDAVGKISVKAEANNRPHITATGAVGNDSYGAGAAAISEYTASSTVNVKSDIKSSSNTSGISIQAINDSWEETCSADTSSGISAFAQKIENYKSQFLGDVFQKVSIGGNQPLKFLADTLPQNSDKKFNVAATVAFVDNKYFSKVYIAPSVKINSLGDVLISSKTIAEDVNIKAISKGTAGCYDTKGNKSGVNAGVTYSDVAHNADVVIDDSLTNAKTEISGKTVVIKSDIDIPYNRIKRMIEDVEWAITVLKARCSGEQQKQLLNNITVAWNKMKDSFRTFSDLTGAESVKAFGTGLVDLLKLIPSLSTLASEEFGVVNSAISILTNAFNFASFSNYLNIAANAGGSYGTGKTAENNLKNLSFTGSVDVSYFKNKNHILVGRNANITSLGTGVASMGVDIGSHNYIYMATAVGAPAPYNVNKGSLTIGGSAAVQNFDSVAETVIAEGTAIISDNRNLGIYSNNEVDAIVGAFAASMGSSGFDGMATFVKGDLHANTLIDDEVTIKSDKTFLQSYNHDNIFNLAGAIMVADNSGVGIGLAITDFDKETQVKFADNEQKVKELRVAYGLASTSETLNKLSVTATQTVNVFEGIAKTSGTFNAIGVAGAITAYGDSGVQGSFGKLISNVSGFFGSIAGTVESGIDNIVEGMFGKLGFNNLNNIANDRRIPITNEKTKAGDRPKFSLDVAGSTGVNIINNTTKVEFNKANIELKGSDARIGATSINTAHTLTFGGAAGLNFNKFTKAGNQNQTTVGVNGTVALNYIDDTTDAKIVNSKIKDAKEIDTIAANGGETVATALGLSLNNGSGAEKKTHSVNADFSVNHLNDTTSAIHENNTVTGVNNKADVNVTAYNGALQVTGGLGLNVGNQKSATSAAVDISQVTNTITASITGGTYSHLNDFITQALIATRQVNAAAAVSAVPKSQETSYAFAGAAAWNEITNENTAKIKGTTIKDTGSVKVTSRDLLYDSDAAEPYQDLLDRDSAEMSFIDKEGKCYYNGLDTATNTADLATVSNDRKGSLIVTAAAAGSGGGVPIGVGFALNKIDNTITSDVTNATIKANDVNINSSDNTLIITVGGGVAVGMSEQHGAGAGSVAWSDVTNAASSKISNSTIDISKLDVYAANEAYITSVSGQISGSIGKGAGGASLAFNKITNSAEADVSGGTISGSSSSGKSARIMAENKGTIVGIGVSGSGSNTGTAVNGVLVINEIKNDSEATIGSTTAKLQKTTTFKNIDNLSVNATDTAKIYSLSGAITAGFKGSGGGAVAVNNITGSTTASIDYGRLDRVGNVKVTATNDSKIMTMGAGFGGAGTFAFDGAATDGDIFRDVTASINNTVATDTSTRINVDAKSQGTVDSLAAVVAGSGKVAIGAGVAVNRIKGDTTASAKKNTFDLQNFVLRSDSNQTINTIGAAGTGAGAGGGSGSFAYNELNNNTYALVDGGSVLAKNNVGVVAQSDDCISNYAGILSIGGTAGVGVSLGINYIDGTTKANIKNATVAAEGNSSTEKVTVNNKVDNSDIYDDYASIDSIDLNFNLRNERTSENLKGITVDSSSTRTMKSFIASIAGGGTAGVNANVNVNYIGGKTEATLENSTVNSTLKVADSINVKASDYTDSAAFIGSVAIGGGGSVGISPNNNRVERDTTAKIDKLKSGSKASDVVVMANSKQGLSTLTAGAAGAGTGALAANSSVALLGGNTTAEITNSNLTVKSLDVYADHYARAHVLAGSAALTGVGAGGVAISVTNDKSHVKSQIATSTISMNSNSSGEVKVRAKSDSSFESTTAAVGLGLEGFGAAGSIGVNYTENTVDANVYNSTIGSASKRARSVSVSSEDLSKVYGYGGTLGGGTYAGIGLAVNVGSINSKTHDNLYKSNIYSVKDIKVDSKEEKSGEQCVGNGQAGAVAVGINVNVYNIGEEFSSIKGAGQDDTLANANKTAKKVIQQDNVSGYDFGYLSDATKKKIQNFDVKTSVGKSGEAVTGIAVDNSTLDSSSGDVYIGAETDGNLNITAAGIGAGIAAINTTFGIVNNNQSVVADVNNSTIKSKGKTTVLSNASGTSLVQMVQGSAGIAAINGSLSQVNMTGYTSVNLNKANITSQNDLIDIKAIDNTSANTEVYGVQAGGVAFGAISSDVNNRSFAEVNVASSTLIASDNIGSSISITAEKNNRLDAYGFGITGAVGAFGVIEANATDIGGSTIQISSGNTFKSKEVNLNSNNFQNITSKLLTHTHGGITVGSGDIIAKENGLIKLNVAKGNSFAASAVNMHAVSDTKLDSTSKAYNVGVVGIDVNEAKTISDSTVLVGVDIGDKDYRSDAVLHISADNNTVQSAYTDGLGVGVVYSTINNESNAEANLTTDVTVNGTGNGAGMKSLSVSSNASATHHLYANGDGGGLISISPYAASVESNFNFDTKTNIKGKIAAAKTEADSSSSFAAYTGVEATGGTLAGGNGTEAKVNATVNTKTNVLDNASINSKEIVLNSENNFVTGSEKISHNSYGANYGGFAGSGNESKQHITANSEVNIGKAAKLNASDSIRIDANTIYNLSNKVLSKGAGVGIHPYCTADNDLTINNLVTTAEKSELFTDGIDADINIGTYNDYNANLESKAEVQGSAGGSTKSTSSFALNNTNKVDISGSIKSYHDVNIYTNKDSEGKNSKIYTNLSSEAYTKSLISWSTDAILKNNSKRNNYINVNSTGSVESVRHATLYAAQSAEKYDLSAKEYKWFHSSDNTPDTTTVAAGKSDKYIKLDNAIKVDGKVVAGIHNKIDFTIDGKVHLDKNISGSDILRAPNITTNNSDYKALTKVESIEYANRLYKRYQEIEKLCAEYDGTQIGLSYKAELVRIKNEMIKYGLYDEKASSPVGSLYIDVIELPNMISSGGNVYLSAESGTKVTGKGLIQAKGAPEINITNNSNLYMVVNDLTIGEYGGQILLNDVSLGEKAQSTLKVKEAKTDASSGSKIDIKENWNSVYDLKYKNPDDGKTNTLTYAPITNVEVNGHISNPLGIVSIYNAKKDIVLQGKTAEDSASIQGAAITLKAEGAIQQGYTQGITNVGYTPEYVWNTYAKNYADKISKGVTYTATKEDGTVVSAADIQKMEEEYRKQHPEYTGGTWISGDMVFLNSDDINVNGIIQSGYSTYQVTLDSSLVNGRIAEIKKVYDSKNKPSVSESYLSQYCKLNDGGMKWDADSQVYKYEVQAYYNPENNTIVLEDINSSGGQIYLTGRISSTGSGKLIAADGPSDITINNKTGIKLVTPKLDASDRTGLISITDLAKTTDNRGNQILGTLTEITSKETKTWYIGKGGQNQNPDVVSDSIAMYMPLAGLAYNWTTGFTAVDEFRHEETYKFLFWGAINYGKKCSDTLREKIEKGEISPQRKDTPKLAGTYIGTSSLGNNNYHILYNNNIDYRSNPITGGKTHYNTFLHASGKQYEWAIIRQGSTNVFQHSLKADLPIQIAFLKGSGNIDVNSNSDLSLSRDITTNSGKITLTSTMGAIEQTGGQLKADNVWMKATKGIGSNKAIEQLLSSADGTLSAKTTSGNVCLNSFNIGGLANSKLKLTATTDNGDVNILADGSILSGNTGLDIKGSRIDLVSKNGSIGTSNALLKVNAGQVTTEKGNSLSASINAQAADDVALEQISGDMRIGKIVSLNGDVYLTSEGSILDALPPKSQEVQSKSAEKLIQSWKEAGIISEDGSDNAEARKKLAIENYEKSNRNHFARYEALKSYFADGKHTSSTDPETFKEYQGLKEVYGNYTNADKWLEAQKTDPKSELSQMMNNIKYGWSQDELLYAIQDSIINKDTGSTVAEKDPSDANIKARNVVLKAGKGIGKDEGSKVVDISNLYSKEGIEVLKELAETEASDINWGYNGDIKDVNKATINKVQGIFIDAKGTVSATAKDNIYLHDVAGNQVAIDSVTSKEGNVRIYSTEGLVNVGKYSEGASDNTINVTAKDAILEGGNGTIGTADKPFTTDLSGYLTARSEGLLNIYQLGSNALTISAMYSGANINLRALNSIYSVYNGIQAQELGYVSAKGDIYLLSDNGDIGQTAGKWFRVKTGDKSTLNAEANNIYIKANSEGELKLGDITVRDGNFGLYADKADLVLTKDMTADNIEFYVKSVLQNSGKLVVNTLLSITSANGILLESLENMISAAIFKNTEKSFIALVNNCDITFKGLENSAKESGIIIENNGNVNSECDITSNNYVFLFTDSGNLNLRDVTAKKDVLLYTSNGDISFDTVSGGDVEILTDNGNLIADSIDSENNISVGYKNSGICGNVDIGKISSNNTASVYAKNGEITLHSADVKNSLMLGTQSSGDVVLSNVKADSVAVTTEKGDINAEKITANSQYTQSIGEGNGTVHNISANLILTNSKNGNIEFSDIKNCKYLFVNNEISGNITLIDNDTKVDYVLQLATEKGDISSRNIHSDLISIETNDGSINSENLISDNGLYLKASGKTSGIINATTIISEEGSVDISATDGLNSEKVSAGSAFNISVDGDVKIKELSSRNEGEKADESTLVTLSNVKIDSITTGGSFNATSGGSFYSDEVKTGRDASIVSSKEIKISTLESGDSLNVVSEEGGDIWLDSVYSKDQALVYNRNGGSLWINNVKSDSDLFIINDGTGEDRIKDLDIANNFYSYIKDGVLDFGSSLAIIGGDISVEGENADILARNLMVGRNLNFRTNYGYIQLSERNEVDGDAYITSDNDNVYINKLNVGNDLKVDALELASVSLATVNGNILIMGKNKGVEASSLIAGKDLVASTDHGHIEIDSADIGENTYVTVNGFDGGHVDITSITTGNLNDFTGDLIVDSASLSDDAYVRIEDAVSGFKLLINSFSAIHLSSAKAFGGYLEINGLGDIVADFISAAGKAVVNAFCGNTLIHELISGDTLSVRNYIVGDIIIDKAKTLNEDADIIVESEKGNVVIADTHSARNVELQVKNGNLVLADVTAENNFLASGNGISALIGIRAKDIDIDLNGDSTIYNLSAQNDISLKTKGEAAIENISAKNNIFMDINGISKVKAISSEKNLSLAFNGNSDVSDVYSKNVTITTKGTAKISAITSEDSMSLTADGNSFISDVKSEKAMEITLAGDESELENVSANSLILSNSNKNLIANSLTADKLSFDNSGNADITGITSPELFVANSGSAVLNNVTGSELSLNNTGSAVLKDITGSDFLLDNAGSADLANVDYKVFSVTNDGKLSLSNVNSENLKLDNNASGNANLINLNADDINMTNAGKLLSDTITSSKNIVIENINTASSEFGTISANNFKLENQGEVRIEKLQATGNLEVANDGRSILKEVSSKKIDIFNNGNLSGDILSGSNVNLANKGTLSFDKFTGKTVVIDSDNKININNLSSDSILKLTLGEKSSSSLTNVSAPVVEINNSGFLASELIEARKLTANNSGKADVNSINAADFDFSNSGESVVDSVKAEALLKIKSSNGSLAINTATTNDMAVFETTGGAIAINELTANGNIKGTLAGGKLAVADLNANSNLYVNSSNNSFFEAVNANIKETATLKLAGASAGIDNLNVGRDFNMAVATNANSNFGKMVIGNDMNIYAGKGGLKASSLNVGRNLNTYAYGKFTEPVLAARSSNNLRASLNTSNWLGSSYINPLNANNTARKAKENEGFVLDIDEVNIGGGLYINNPDVTIKSQNVVVGNDVKITDEKSKIDIDNIDVQGGSMKIKSTQGSVNIGKATVDGATDIDMTYGDMHLSDLQSRDEVTLKTKNGNIVSEKSIESRNNDVNISVNGIGNVEAYKILAKKNGNISAYNGDIIIGEINGKTLVFNEETNNRNLQVEKATVADKLYAASSDINFKNIEHTDDSSPLDIELPGVKGRAMNNVNIGNVETTQGVDLNGLMSFYADIHVDHRYFSLSNVYLLHNGKLSNTDTKFKLYGFRPQWDNESDVIAYFVPREGRPFAAIDFIDKGKVGSKDYYALTAKSGFNRMFDEYTVVQRIEAMNKEFYSKHCSMTLDYLDDEEISDYVFHADDSEAPINIPDNFEEIVNTH